MEYNGKNWMPLKKEITTENNSKEVFIVSFVMVVVTIAFLLGTKLGHGDGEVYQQRLAIKAGVGHYVADEQGFSKFEYIKK